MPTKPLNFEQIQTMRASTEIVVRCLGRFRSRAEVTGVVGAIIAEHDDALKLANRALQELGISYILANDLNDVPASLPSPSVCAR